MSRLPYVALPVHHARAALRLVEIRLAELDRIEQRLRATGQWDEVGGLAQDAREQATELQTALTTSFTQRVAAPSALRDTLLSSVP